MREFLQSGITLGICIVMLLAWCMMLCAIFWPRKSDRGLSRKGRTHGGV